MLDWLELELAQQLAPVEAPPALTWRVLAPAAQAGRARRTFRLFPFVAAVAALAVVVLAVLPGVTTPAAVNRYLQREAGIEFPIPASTHAVLERARIVNENGARIAAVTYRLNHTKATVLIARAGTVRGAEWRPHGQAYVIACAEPQTACLLCHANL
jgi:hypothetical protein